MRKAVFAFFCLVTIEIIASLSIAEGVKPKVGSIYNFGTIEEDNQTVPMEWLCIEATNDNSKMMSIKGYQQKELNEKFISDTFSKKEIADFQLDENTSDKQQGFTQDNKMSKAVFEDDLIHPIIELVPEPTMIIEKEPDALQEIFAKRLKQFLSPTITPSPLMPSGYSVRVLCDESMGTVTTSADRGNTGDIITLTANPNPGFALEGWQIVSGEKDSTLLWEPGSSFAELTVGTSDIVVMANFVPGYKLEFSVSPEGAGAAFAQKYHGKEDEMVSISANANEDGGWVFDHWEIDRGKDAEITNAISSDSKLYFGCEDVNIRAVFKQGTRINYIVEPAGAAGRIKRKKAAKVGERIYLGSYVEPTEVEEESEWVVDHWELISGSDSMLSNNKHEHTAELTVGEQEITVKAVLAKGHRIICEVSPENSGNVDCTNFALTGQKVILRALNNEENDESWTFDHWELLSGKNARIGEDKTSETELFVGNDDVRIKAVFVKGHKVECVVAPEEAGHKTYISTWCGWSGKSGDAVPIDVKSTGREWVFDHWELISGLGAEIVDPTNSSTYVVLGKDDVKVKAVFVKEGVRIKYQVEPKLAGSITGDHLIKAGGSDRIYANADDLNGWEFDHWEIINGGSDTWFDEDSNTLHVGEEATEVTVKAVFHKNIKIRYCVDPNYAGTASGDSIAKRGEIADINAYPSDSGYVFDHWTILRGDGAIIGYPYRSASGITVGNSDVLVQAIFVKAHKMTCQIEPINAGDARCVQYENNEKVFISATPYFGYVFDHWEVVGGDATIDDPNQAVTQAILGNSDAIVKAVFSKGQKVQIINNPRGLGNNHSAYPDTGKPGDKVYIGAGAIDLGDYVFDHWVILEGKGASIEDVNSDSTTLTIGSSDVKLEAVYTKNYKVRCIVTPNNSCGTVSCYGRNKNICSLYAIPNSKEGWVFKEWVLISGTGASIYQPFAQETKVVIGSSDVEVKAVFEKGSKISCCVEPEGAGTASASQSCLHGGTTYIYAIPNTVDGYVFKEWVLISGTGASIIGKEEQYATINVGSDDVKVKAVFEKGSKINFIAEPADAGFPSGAKCVHFGESTMISANPYTERGYVFKEWVLISGTDANIENPFSQQTILHVGSDNVEVKAVYEKGSKITYCVEPESAGTASGAPTCFYGGTTQIYASPNTQDGWAFKEWQLVKGTEASIGSTTSLGTILHVGSDDVTIKAVFGRTGNITCNISPEEDAGRVSWSPSYMGDGSLYLSAIPNTQGGWIFKEWKFSGVEGKIENPSQMFTKLFVGLADVQITAVFEKENEIKYNIKPTGAGFVESLSNEDGTIKLMAYPNVEVGWVFDYWNVVGENASIDNVTKQEANLTVGDSDVTVTAHFKKAITDIMIECLAGEGGTAYAENDAAGVGETVVIHATPVVGMMFAGWRIDSGTNVAIEALTAPDTVLTVGNDNVRIIALFAPVEQKTAAVDPERKGSKDSGIPEDSATITDLQEVDVLIVSGSGMQTAVGDTFRNFIDPEK